MHHDEHHNDGFMDGMDLMFGKDAAFSRETGGAILTAIAVATASVMF